MDPPLPGEGWLPLANGRGGLQGDALVKALTALGFRKGDTIQYLRKGSTIYTNESTIYTNEWGGTGAFGGHHVSINYVRPLPPTTPPTPEPTSNHTQTKDEAQALLKSLPVGTRVSFQAAGFFSGTRTGIIAEQKNCKYVEEELERSFARWSVGVSQITVLTTNEKPAASSHTPAATQGTSPMRTVIRTVVANVPAPTEKHPDATTEVVLEGPTLSAVPNSAKSPSVQDWLLSNPTKFTDAKAIPGTLQILEVDLACTRYITV